MTPDEFAGPTPQLVTHDAAQAIEFYRRVFGADELTRHHSPEGRIMHCELLIAGGRLFVIDEIDGDPASSPRALGGTTSRLHVYVPDVDETHDRFVASGGASVVAPADTFWGDRYAEARDPFGHLWSIATTVDDLSPDEMREQAHDWTPPVD